MWTREWMGRIISYHMAVEKQQKIRVGTEMCRSSLALCIFHLFHVADCHRHTSEIPNYSSCMRALSFVSRESLAYRVWLERKTMMWTDKLFRTVRENTTSFDTKRGFHLVTFSHRSRAKKGTWTFAYDIVLWIVQKCTASINSPKSREETRKVRQFESESTFHTGWKPSLSENVKKKKKKSCRGKMLKISFFPPHNVYLCQISALAVHTHTQHNGLAEQNRHTHESHTKNKLHSHSYFMRVSFSRIPTLSRLFYLFLLCFRTHSFFPALYSPMCMIISAFMSVFDRNFISLVMCFFSHSIIQVSRSHTHSHTHPLAHLKNCTHTPLLSPYIVDFNFSTDRQAFGMLMARSHTFMPREHENIHDRDEKRSKRVTESSQCLGFGIYPLSLSVPFIM